MGRATEATSAEGGLYSRARRGEGVPVRVIERGAYEGYRGVTSGVEESPVVRVGIRVGRARWRHVGFHESKLEEVGRHG